jgi:hypothetical protein
MPRRIEERLLAEQATDSWIPSSDEEKAAVQEQLDRLLATPFFNSSKRYPSFLKFVVSRSLAGQTDQLKERILGIEVFGRPADYDTHTDPIVRVTAAEIRKRVEQYYQDPKHSQEIRFFLPAGSYAPQFSWPGRPAGLSTVAVTEPLSATPELSVAQMEEPKVDHVVPSKKRFLSWKSVTPVVLAGVLLAALAVVWFSSRQTVLRQFWDPFIRTPEPILFSIADQRQYSTIRLRDAADPQKEITLNDSMVTIIIDDVSPLVNIAGLLRTYGKNYRVLGEGSTTLTDLRRGPSVFIGAFDNGWTLRLAGPLKYHFANDQAMSRFWIEDRTNPTKRDWVLDRSVQQQTGTYKDYAIVARLVDPNTEQFVVIAAGIGRGGTVAAGEFLVDTNRMDEMLKQVPQDWTHKNLEVVLETQVIDGRSGSPRVVTAHVW